MYASRNIELCSKDCLCLFVCPTGAADTETGQIDRDLCLDGCRLCVDACPSHAIYLVMNNYPEPGVKNEELTSLMMALLERKTEQEQAARNLESAAQKPGEKKLAMALGKSLRILAEDCAREAGFMLPQSRSVRDMLKELTETVDSEKNEIISKLLREIGKVK
ncbi:MAG: 4Fe-4S ferredoxin [Spirochaetia bacterium]|nr:4Fe-4S ferredoxin [Spirochaetia bacterium]